MKTKSESTVLDAFKLKNFIVIILYVQLTSFTVLFFPIIP